MSQDDRDIDVDGAARRLQGVAHRTPVLTSRTLDHAANAQVFVKAENLQRSGAFKFRGAYNKLASLDAATRARGVAAFSSGNHAGAVALAAKLFGTQAVILMPTDAPTAKLEAAKEYGAEIVTYDRYTQDREQLGRQLTEERQLTLIPPYDDVLVIAGQGTAAKELLEDVPDLDAIVVPVGGGGLAAGTCIAAKGTADVIGVEPEAGDDTKRSLATGERITIPVPHTIADGQQITAPGQLTFPINQRHLKEVVLVSDDELVEAMRFCFERMKLVTEPSGVCGIAALLQHQAARSYKKIGVILSGGNVGATRFAELLGRATPS